MKEKLFHKILVLFLILFFVCLSISISIESEKRLIQLSPTERKWVTMQELIKLTSNGINLFDITDHPNLSPLEGQWEPVVPSCCFNQEVVSELISFLSTINMFNTVQQLSSFHTRYYQSNTGVSAAEWIYNTVAEYIQASAMENYAEVNFFNHSWAQPSVIARIPGTTLVDEIVILGAHLDSIISDQSEFPPYPRSPGADDDASGCSNVLEVLRVFLQEGYIGKRTVEFHFYSAEEVGLRGSQDIATSYQSQGTKVAGMLQLDMTGFPNMTHPRLRMINDYNNEQLMNFLKEVASTYSSISWYNSECGYACSDHASWNQTGFYSCRVKEDGNYTSIHTANDVISNLWFPYSLEFAKVALGYLVELSTNVANAFIGQSNPIPHHIVDP